MAKPDLQITHKSVATWIRKEDFVLLQELSARNNVTVASYIRGIIVDAIQDELENCISSPDSIQLDLLV